MWTLTTVKSLCGEKTSRCLLKIKKGFPFTGEVMKSLPEALIINLGLRDEQELIKYFWGSSHDICPRKAGLSDLALYREARSQNLCRMTVPREKSLCLFKHLQAVKSA